MRNNLGLNIGFLGREMLAGMTLAMLAIPEALGYSLIAGMPVISGLFTLLLPMVLFAVLGSSRHLVVGADSATAAMMAAGLAGLALPSSADYVALAGMLALFAGLMLLLARLFRLGFLANFLSRTVLVGFLSGVSIQVAWSQLPAMVGLVNADHTQIYSHIMSSYLAGASHLLPLLLSVSAVLLMSLLKKPSAHLPIPLLLIGLATLASWLLGFEAQGVMIVGDLPSGLPEIALPNIPINWPLMEQLITLAFSIVIVIVAQSAATASAYAELYGEELNENRDLVGLGVANIAAAITGAFVVNGSPTKTRMVDTAGGRSQIAQSFAAAAVLFVLLFLTGPLAFIPQPILASVVFMIGVSMIDIDGMRRVYAERPIEFWVAITTLVIVVVWGVESGILMAIVLSLIMHTRHGYRPKNSVIRLTPNGRWQAQPIENAEQLLPGLMVYRFNHSAYYANRSLLAEQVQTLVAQSRPGLTWFCLDCIAIDDIDYSAAETLRRLKFKLTNQNIRLVLTAVASDVMSELQRSGLVNSDSDALICYESLEDLVNAYRRQHSI